ncbi:MAG TPA: AbiV family abortive infection protein [Terriglobales bacterium]|nr:AbiV family abortive infection protein [Terriglobales bacterium]
MQKKSNFLEAAEACIANGKRLLDDADWVLHTENPAATSFALAMIAQEEFAKAFLLFLVDRGVIDWNSFLHRAMRDHTCKQLLGLVLNHLAPDWDEEEKRHKEWRADLDEHRRLIDEYKGSSDKGAQERIWKRIEEISGKWDSLPPAIADAIFILRHEKIGRWESSTWCWAEEPTYDPLAKGLADGKLDRKKQDALYVRLGSDGQVANTPLGVRHDDAKTAMENADRMRFFVEYMFDRTPGSTEYEKIESAFKTVFATSEKQGAGNRAEQPTIAVNPDCHDRTNHIG